MLTDSGWVNGNHVVDRVAGVGGNHPTMSSSLLLTPSSSPSPSSSNGAVNYIEHYVSKFDTLAGVAIKYGVEVADIKRMNGLVTDRQMFALKSLRIPLPGRKSSIEQTPSRQSHSDLLESFQSLGLKSPQRRVSPAMSTLQGYYGLKPSTSNGTLEGTEMAVYKSGRSNYLEDGLPPKPSPSSDSLPIQHWPTRSLLNSFALENGELYENLLVTEAGDSEAERSNEKSVRRRQKAEDFVSRTPEKLLKEENSGGSSGFSAITGKGLAQRPKSASRTNLASDAESAWLTPIPVGLGDSLMTNGCSMVRKSSSTSNLQDQESNNSSIWPTSKWSLKTDLQALSTSALTRPLFDGLPKPITGLWNKAALD
uniref:LysM domain-containing protein n=1 Tax=Nelumbo nucifera TaxID=4432 RepID=A0A822YV79_NELNU|nr:TPA_asm: hypothetical protein HUJ06_006643 [Nelumbo nucifera]